MSAKTNSFALVVALFPSPALETCSLDQQPCGPWSRICAVRLDAGEGSWLAAVGLAVGTSVQVVRRAPFGGPLHIRTGSGGEFAVDLALAREITVVAELEAGP